MKNLRVVLRVGAVLNAGVLRGGVTSSFVDAFTIHVEHFQPVGVVCDRIG